MTHEAIINGDEINTIDPVVRIIIDNGFHRYEFSPEQVGLIEIRAIADRSATAPRRETGVARKGESGGAGTAIAQGQIT